MMHSSKADLGQFEQVEQLMQLQPQQPKCCWLLLLLLLLLDLEGNKEATKWMLLRKAY